MSDGLVMFGGVMFCEVVGKIVGGQFPQKFELFLCFAIAEPPVTHIHGFGSALFNSVVDETKGSGVVENYCGGCLGKSHFF